MMAGSGGELAKRVGVAALGIPTALGVAYLGGYWLAAFLAVFAGVAAWEFCEMQRSRDLGGSARLTVLLAVAYVLLAATFEAPAFAVWATLLTLAAAATVMLTLSSEAQPGRQIMVATFGALYTGGLLAFAVWIRDIDGRLLSVRGGGILLLPVAITWIGDTAAYFGGRAIGRHKLAPKISPGKTREGAVAGFVATTAGALGYAEATRPLVNWTLSPIALLAFGAAVAVAGQIGDLFESRFKREWGAKDSSSLLPGHGGVLDRLDSLLFVFPVAYAFLWWLGT
ncbi:MAG: phosphatidate cytidylyltransferase [Gemmatimonadota bacterium]|nr:MAG: phosphatidate cytidylyltransferase [Gemmatimonadota bacterium]